MTPPQTVTAGGRMPGPKRRGLFATDFDGTLLRSDKTFNRRDLAALAGLERLGIARVVATGRSLGSFLKVDTRALPVDYVIFSTGAGLAEWPSGRLIRKQSLSAEQVRHVSHVLLAAGLDFMLLKPIPDTHRCAYFSAGRPAGDFARRLELYRPWAERLADQGRGFGAATQALVIVPPQAAAGALALVRARLPQFSVIRTTSPLDGVSTWIEIFPAGVSKGAALRWLAAELAVDRRDTCAVGNDYNDEDLLAWSASGYVVANAPDRLRARFVTVGANDAAGVAEAISDWCARRRPSASRPPA